MIWKWIEKNWEIRFKGKSLSDEPVIIQLLANIIQSKNSEKTKIFDENQTNKLEWKQFKRFETSFDLHYI